MSIDAQLVIIHVELPTRLTQNGERKWVTLSLN